MVLEKTLETLDCKEIKVVNPKGNQPCIFIGRTEAEAPILWVTWCEEMTHWKRPWCWERLKAGGEGDDRGWDGWMASLTQRTWVWASSGRWWRTGQPGMLQSLGSQRVRHDWVIEWQQWYKYSHPCPLHATNVTSAGSTVSENLTAAFEQAVQAASRAPLHPGIRGWMLVRRWGRDRDHHPHVTHTSHSAPKALPKKILLLRESSFSFMLNLNWKTYFLFQILLHVFYWIFQSSNQ